MRNDDANDDDQHDPLCSEGEYRGDQRLDCDCSRTGHPSVTSRPDQAATKIDDGNTYVFCDHVERVDFSDHRGCVRGAGHNGPHVFQQRNVGSPMLMPVVLQVGSVQRSEPANAQERSAKENHQTTPDPAIDQAREQHLYAIGRFRVSGELDPVIDTLDVLIKSSASRLQEVETENDYLRRRLNNENWKQAAAMDFGSMAKRAEKAELRLQEVEAERAWHPIESAPKDGTFLLLWCVGFEGGTDGHFDVGSWHDIYSGGSWWERGMEYTVHPTHWMPIPSPPGSVSEVAGEASPSPGRSAAPNRPPQEQP